MGASRPEISKEIKMECGCWYQFSPDRFVRGERMFTCRHMRTWKISAIPVETTYVAEDVTPPEDNG